LRRVSVPPDSVGKPTAHRFHHLQLQNPSKI
jgi:hypothetical protein